MGEHSIEPWGTRTVVTEYPDRKPRGKPVRVVVRMYGYPEWTPRITPYPA